MRRCHNQRGHRPSPLERCASERVARRWRGVAGCVSSLQLRLRLREAESDHGRLPTNPACQVAVFRLRFVERERSARRAQRHAQWQQCTRGAAESCCSAATREIKAATTRAAMRGELRNPSVEQCENVDMRRRQLRQLLVASRHMIGVRRQKRVGWAGCCCRGADAGSGSDGRGRSSW